VRRDIDLSAGDLITIVDKLSKISHRVTPARRLPLGTVLDYNGAIEVFDVIETGRVLVVWTVSFSAPDARKCVAEVPEHEAFRDFIEQLTRELRGTSQSDLAFWPSSGGRLPHRCS
jgi:hypothetical protein